MLCLLELESPVRASYSSARFPLGPALACLRGLLDQLRFQSVHPRMGFVLYFPQARLRMAFLPFFYVCEVVMCRAPGAG